MENTNTGMLKKIGTTLPQLSVFILLLGLTKQILYYKNFNLPIKYFIGISELGMVVADDLLIYGTFIVLYIIFAFAISGKIVKRLNSKDTNKLIKVDNPIHDKKKLNWGGITITIFKWIIFLGFALVLFYMIIEQYREYHYYNNLSIASYLIFFLTYFTDTHFNKFMSETFPTNENRIFFISSMLMTSFIILNTRSEIINIERMGVTIGTTIKTDNKEYISTDSSYFIGKSDKYVFFYNKQSKATNVIPTDLIKEFILIEKPYSFYLLLHFKNVYYVRPPDLDETPTK